MDLYAPWAVTPWQAILGTAVLLLVCLAGNVAAWGPTLERWEREVCGTSTGDDDAATGIS